MRVRLLHAVKVGFVDVSRVDAERRVDDVVRVIEAVNERHGALAQFKAEIGDLLRECPRELEPSVSFCQTDSQRQ